jgi:polyhydroxyalkanoate synthesis regulator protein
LTRAAGAEVCQRQQVNKHRIIKKYPNRRLESGGTPMFTTDILMRIIRFYGASVQDALTTYLEQSLNMFDQQQRVFKEQITGAMQHGPINAITEMTQRNLKIWQDIQNRFFEAATKVAASENDKEDEEKK